MKHATDLENMLADYNNLLKRQRRYLECMNVDLEQLSRDTGIVSIEQQDYIQRRCHAKTKDDYNDTDWFMVIYIISWTAIVGYLGYEFFPAFVAMYHSIF